MLDLISLFFDVFICPFVDLFVVFRGNVFRWVVSGVYGLGSVVLILVSVWLFHIGWWPLGLVTGALTVLLFILDCRNTLDARKGRNIQTDVAAEVSASKNFESNRLQDKASEIRSGLDNRM